MKTFSSHRPLGIRLGLIFLVCFSAVIGSPSNGAETINLKIKPRWTDANHFWFIRQSEDGSKETIDVDALTGSMTVRSADPNRAASDIEGLKGGPIPHSVAGSSGDTEIKFVNQTNQPITAFWVTSDGKRVKYATIKPGSDMHQHTYTGHAWAVFGEDGTFYGSITAKGLGQDAIAKESYSLERGPEERRRGAKRSSAARSLRRQDWEVRLIDGKLQRRTTKDQQGSWQPVAEVNALLGDQDRLTSPQISPDDRFLAIWKKTEIPTKSVATIESSPKDGGRAVLRQRPYLLPGDPVDQFELIVCDTETWEPLELELPIFDFGTPRIRFFRDHEILIQKVDRGHQRFRLFCIDPATASVRTPIDESTDTFIWTMNGPGFPILTYLEKSDQVIYASERSGWRHLYLVDLDSDGLLKPITQGEFLVRDLIEVDEENQTIDLAIGSYHADQDPYHKHLARVKFDGSHFVVLSDGNGDHQWQFSPDRRYVVVSYSRVDQPPIHELRRCDDGSIVATLAIAKRIPQSDEILWEMPTVFSAKGRDGQTDIWGLITFPPNYDPDADRKYPVIEAIYAGPHGSHVPKRYRGSPFHKDLNDLGFIVVQIDGQGTANRSKAFHDVCWQNLKDAGFPDRIAWMKAAAKEYPGMDLDRVGIYGTSAGGQNAMGALLFHGDFYKAAMAACGCHDNRMDKASWNEQWMGYPVGPHYAECSNVDNAHRLEGNLLLILGELDSNVPPESTLRVVDALIKADKDFEFLMVPGIGHSSGGPYGWRRTKDFFVRALQP
ncbi:Prolyl tripeptidyl peptidase precursor [Novipirellula aureliae]|uniref:Prolyl tripeptidyl peptidase n=1 Tax=Novipirellula aureliae TaxID=2527966 RepID=A0A5C6E6R9_9BACT|nr:prolyl oligopeptidase family serine peptidase [Novipirellula aureliae]TWU45343.1 Prolyl tripeptidyl peptidase precursor [Novipirellula aureliae]